jgi:hypothetical protein
MHGCLKYLQRKEIGFCVSDTVASSSLCLMHFEYFTLFSSMELFIVLIELFLVWCFMQNDIINIKLINIVTPETMCFDHTLAVARHFLKILSNAFITLYSHSYPDMGHMG